MATQNQNTEKITVGEMVRATVRVNNLNDAARTRDISAEVEINGTQVTNIQNGIVREKDSQTQTAGFSQYANSQLNMSFMRENNREDEMNAVSAFIADAKNHVYGI